jgi:pimeloyl-ACP methyl ester carboxylesterase
MGRDARTRGRHGDGRVLKVLEDGDPAGRLVLVHIGMPNSRLLFARDAQSAHRLGIRLISYDRPGYGGSTRHAGRNVADCAEHVCAIAAPWI